MNEYTLPKKRNGSSCCFNHPTHACSFFFMSKKDIHHLDTSYINLSPRPTYVFSFFVIDQLTINPSGTTNSHSRTTYSQVGSCLRKERTSCPTSLSSNGVSDVRLLITRLNSLPNSACSTITFKPLSRQDISQVS